MPYRVQKPFIRSGLRPNSITLVAYLPISGSLLFAFERVLDGRERILEIGNRAAHRDLSNNRSLGTSQTRLLGTHGHDQIEAGFGWVVTPADTEGEVQRGLEVVARIELLFGDGVCDLVGRFRAWSPPAPHAASASSQISPLPN